MLFTLNSISGILNCANKVDPKLLTITMYMRLPAYACVYART